MPEKAAKDISSHGAAHFRPPQKVAQNGIHCIRLLFCYPVPRSRYEMNAQ
jgi:hypothetical protein